MNALGSMQHGEQLALWLVERAIDGIAPLDSAPSLAQRYRSNPNYHHDAARIDALIRWEASKSFTAGFMTSLGGIVSLPVALPTALGVSWWLQARLAAAVADLRGHALQEPWVRSLVLLSLTGAAAPEMLRQAGVRMGEWTAQRLMQRLSQETLKQINRRVGFRLLATASERGVISVGRLVPVAGAAMGGAIDAYGCYAVAKAAKKLLEPPRLIGGKSVADDEPLP